MYRASIFQQNIVNNTDRDTIDLIISFNHAMVDITSTKITITSSKGTFSSDIQLLEKNAFTITHKGKLNGVPFRLVQPQGAALEMTKKNHNARGGFTIASFNPNDFAIHFILTDKDDVRDLTIGEKGTDDQIQRIIDGAFMSLQFEAHQKFIELTKRLVSMMKSNPAKIRTFNRGIELSEIMKDNLHIYDASEQEIVKRI